jgi:hypothetical protein
MLHTAVDGNCYPHVSRRDLGVPCIGRRKYAHGPSFPNLAAMQTSGTKLFPYLPMRLFQKTEIVLILRLL